VWRSLPRLRRRKRGGRLCRAQGVREADDALTPQYFVLFGVRALRRSPFRKVRLAAVAVQGEIVSTGQLESVFQQPPQTGSVYSV